MDERVNDFLKEIEEIVPETSNTNSKRKRSRKLNANIFRLS